MRSLFVKLYGDKLVQSSLWETEPEARLVFIAMLAIADENGFVDAPAGIPTLSRLLNLTPDYIERALAILEAPDPLSRSPEEGGRRLIHQRTGWHVVTYREHRETRTLKNERDRLRIAAKRKQTPGAAPRERRANARGARAVVDELEARESSTETTPAMDEDFQPDTEGAEHAG